MYTCIRELLNLLSNLIDLKIINVINYEKSRKSIDGAREYIYYSKYFLNGFSVNSYLKKTQFLKINNYFLYPAAIAVLAST